MLESWTGFKAVDADAKCGANRALMLGKNFRASIVVSSISLASLLCISACRPDAAPSTQPAPPSSEVTAQSTETTTQAPQEIGLSKEQIFAQSNLPAQTPAPVAGDLMQVTIHRLSNGMTVYISPNPKKPRFSAWIAVRAGSRHDPADSTGLAHYLEHMLFKGTDEIGTLDMKAESAHLQAIKEQYAKLREAKSDSERKAIMETIDRKTQASAAYAVPNEFDRMYSELGIRGLNAFTDKEETVYIADVPSNRLEAWAKVEAERFADPSFRLFFPELEAVYEEKNRALDSPGRRAYEAMMAGVFPNHPYGTQDTLGKIEHLKTPAFGDMLAYFDRWYAPNNMAIILAGDVQADKVIPVLEQNFGRLQPKPLQEIEKPGITPIQGRTVKEVSAEGSESVMMAWQTVPINHQDQPALEVMDLLMDNAQTGLLNLKLELTQKVPDAGSWPRHLKEGGMWAMRATARDGQSLDEVEQLLLGVASELKAGNFSQQDLQAVVLHSEINLKRRLESNGGRVSAIADSFIHGTPWQDSVAYLQKLKQVTREDVIRVANQYLSQNYTVARKVRGEPELPKIEKPSITPIPIDTQKRSPYAKNILAMPSTPLQPEELKENENFFRLKLPAGKGIFVQNPDNDLFTISYNFDLGTRKSPYLCIATELLEKSGTSKLSAEELRKQFYQLGADVNVGCSVDRSSIRVEGIYKNLDATLALVKDWFSDPKFTKESLEEFRKNELTWRRNAMERPEQIADALEEYARYGSASSWLQEPSNAALAKVNTGTLRQLVKSMPNTAHTTLYFGPGDQKQLSEQLVLGSGSKNPGPAYRRSFETTNERTIYFVGKEVAKSIVSIGIPMGTRSKDERSTSNLLSHYLGGDMSSLFFQQIREARGLAYSTGGRISKGRFPEEPWALFGHIGTQSDKTVGALRVFMGLLYEDIDPARLAASRQALDQSYRSNRAEPRGIPGMVDYWDDLGEKKDPRIEQWNKVLQTTPEQVATLAKELTRNPASISVVGDSNKIDLGELAKLGNLRIVRVEDLFSYDDTAAKPRPRKSAASTKSSAKKQSAKQSNKTDKKKSDAKKEKGSKAKAKTQDTKKKPAKAEQSKSKKNKQSAKKSAKSDKKK